MPLRMWSLAPLLAAAVTGQIGCAPVDQDGAPAQQAFPRVTQQHDDGVVTFEFGPDSLRTTDTAGWRGTNSITFPPVFDPDAGPITVEVDGLDLSEIRYSGDLGWPPDSTDRGATVRISLIGQSRVTYTAVSNLAATRTLWSGTSLDPSELSEYRAYVFQGAIGNDQVSWLHFKPEAWGGPSHPEYDTFDLRFRYADSKFFSWARLHASWSWEDGNRTAAYRCPWNVAINTAAEATADSVWDRTCSAVDSSQTGRVIGAWRAPPPDTSRNRADLGPMQARIAIANWARAYGIARVSWKNVVVKGVPLSGASIAAASGRLRPLGTARIPDLIPSGAEALFSFLVVGRSADHPSTALLRYRTSRLAVSNVRTDWVVADTASIQFAGEGMVNGETGFRYEVHATNATLSEPARFSIHITTFDGLPYYTAFGRLSEGQVTWIGR